MQLKLFFPTDWPIIPFRKKGNPGPIQPDCLWPDCEGSLHSSFPASIAPFSILPSFYSSANPLFPSLLLSNFNCPGKVMVGSQGTKLWFLMNVPVRGLWSAMGSHDVRSCDRRGMILLSDLCEKVESNMETSRCFYYNFGIALFFLFLHLLVCSFAPLFISSFIYLLFSSFPNSFCLIFSLFPFFICSFI